MPKKNGYKKKGFKKKPYNSRLADKKINTLVEKRIKEIAQKEDRKNQQWISPRLYIKDATFNWATHGSILRVPSASCLAINAGTMWHVRMSDFGQYILNNLNTASNTELLSNYVRCKAMKARFDFRYGGTYPSRVRLFLAQVSGGQELAESVTVPNIDMCPQGGLNGYNAFWQRSLKEQLPYKYKILKSMDVVIQPARIYTPAFPLNNNNNTVWNLPIHTEVQKIVDFRHIFEGNGKRFQVNHDDTRTPRQEVYLCMVSTTPMTFNAVATSTFRLDGIQDQVQPTQTVS